MGFSDLVIMGRERANDFGHALNCSGGFDREQHSPRNGAIDAAAHVIAGA